MNKKTWIFVVALVLVLLIAVGVFVGVKTEFFGLLETKEEKKEEETEKEQTKQENNAYRVDCILAEKDDDFGMTMSFGAHFLKKDKSLLDMDANISYDFSSFAEDMSEEEIEEAVASLKEEISGELGLSCESSIKDSVASFQCKSTKEEMLSSLDSTEYIENMNYDKFLENMEETDYTCSTKEVYAYIE